MESGRVGSTSQGRSITAIGPIRIEAASEALIRGLDSAPRLPRSRRVTDPRRLPSDTLNLVPESRSATSTSSTLGRESADLSLTASQHLYRPAGGTQYL